jgi:8-oxo-dGTP pyrophosphatase MutT (NUDIX family)
MKVQHYCLGFCFSPDDQQVLLIRKNRPAWAVGLLNGLGGKVRNDEAPEHAMVREFKEECGLRVTAWRKFGILTANASEVHIFEARCERLGKVRQLTDEEIMVYPVATNDMLMVPSVPWLIKCAQDRTKFVHIQSSTIL